MYLKRKHVFSVLQSDESSKGLRTSLYMSVKPILFLIITIPEKKYTYAGTVSKYIRHVF